MTKELPDKTGDKQARIAAHQFKPGQSGNPSGRPKGSISIVALLKAELEKKPKGHQKTYAALLIDRILKLAITDGEITMVRDVINRVDGLPVQPIGGDPNNPIEYRNLTEEEAHANIRRIIETYVREGSGGIGKKPRANRTTKVKK